MDIKIARYRNTDYVVNYVTNGGIKTYLWSGSKGKKVDIKSIPEEVVNYLLMNSLCFKNGELVIIEETKEDKELVNNIDDLDSYKNNSHTKEEIEKILKGNITKMKKELEKITVLEEKRFIIDVAKEIKLDSASKQNYLAEWMGVPVDILFDED